MEDGWGTMGKGGTLERRVGEPRERLRMSVCWVGEQGWDTLEEGLGTLEEG